MMKTIARSSLLFLVVASLAFWGWGRFGGDSVKSNETADGSLAASLDDTLVADAQVVVVTYFTTDVRCASCLMIENLTMETVAKHSTLGPGQVVYQSINIDRRENRHYMEEYELSFKTVVVSSGWGESTKSWRKMDEVWSFLREPDVFEKYLADEISRRLTTKT